MRLAALLAGLDEPCEIVGSGAIDVTGVSCDLRATRPGDLFVALAGVTTDGARFVADAVARGAVAVAAAGPLAVPVPVVRAPHPARRLGRMAARLAGDPSRELCVAGVTGTNGKTTTTHRLEGIWRAAGASPGVIGTIAYRLALNHLGANGIVGGGIPIATGAGMGIKVRGTDQVVAGFFSDGASNNGVFAQSLNLAGIYPLTVVYLLENNHYAVSTPIECATGCCDLDGRGPAYGVPGICVDGNDAWAVYQETAAAVARARRGQGPTLIEAKTYRHGGHHVNDPGLYMDPDTLAGWKARDPILLMRRAIGDDARTAAIEAQVDAELDAAVEFAAGSPEPSVEEFLADSAD